MSTQKVVLTTETLKTSTTTVVLQQFNTLQHVLGFEMSLSNSSFRG